MKADFFCRNKFLNLKKVVSKTGNGVTGNGVTRNRVTGFFSFFQIVDDDVVCLCAFLIVSFEWKIINIIRIWRGFYPLLDLWAIFTAYQTEKLSADALSHASARSVALGY